MYKIVSVLNTIFNKASKVDKKFNENIKFHLNHKEAFYMRKFLDSNNVLKKSYITHNYINGVKKLYFLKQNNKINILIRK